MTNRFDQVHEEAQAAIELARREGTLLEDELYAIEDEIGVAGTDKALAHYKRTGETYESRVRALKAKGFKTPSDIMHRTYEAHGFRRHSTGWTW